MKYCWILLLSSLGWIFFYGCANDNFEIGQNLVESSGRTIVVDTCTTNMITLLIDSVSTMGQSRLLVGSVDVPGRGIVQSAGYVSFNLPTYTEIRSDLNQSLYFDSLTLILEHDLYYIGDTLSDFTISINELTEELDPQISINNNLYNTSRFSYNPEPLCTAKLRPYPNYENRLNIRLPDEMGIDILNKLSTDADEFYDQNHFEDYLKGLVITATDSENKAIYGFSVGDSSATINLYYHILEEHKQSERVIISGITSNVYNAVDFNTESSPLQNLNNGYNGLPSQQSNNQSFVMGMTGLYTRIEIPYLRNLLELGDAGAIQKAELFLYPVTGSFNDDFPLPEELSLYIADYTNSTVDAITTSYGDALQTGNLVLDDMYGVNTYYSFTITDYLKDELRAIGIYKHNLIITLADTDMQKTFQSVIFGDQDKSSTKVELKITYNVYDKN